MIKTASSLNEAVCFDELIKSILNKNELNVKGKYKIQEKSFKLNINEKDKTSFKKLFTVAPNKGVGNGEISLYWLFNYGDKNNNAIENRSGDNADLIINGKNCEVKSYKSHTMQIILGKFKDDKDSRNILNSVFGISNLSNVFSKSKKVFSEINFKLQDLEYSFDKFLKLKQILEDKNELIQSFQLFDDINKSINELFETIKNFDSKIEEKNNAEIAKSVILNLIKNKLSNKPGNKGYMINCLTHDPTDIYFHYINLSNIFNIDIEKVYKNIRIGSGEIKINYNLFD